MNEEEELKVRRLRLESELDQAIGQAKWRAVANHWSAMILMLIALAGSGLAGALGLAAVVSVKAVAVIALVPAAISAVASQLKPQARSSWHYRKVNGLTELKSRLIFKQPVHSNADQIAAVAEARDDLVRKMQQEWDHGFQFDWSALTHHSKTQFPHQDP